MRSSAPVTPAIPDIQPDSVEIDHFFALKSESEDGLLVVQCTQILGNLQECSTEITSFNDSVWQHFASFTVIILKITQS